MWNSLKTIERLLKKVVLTTGAAILFQVEPERFDLYDGYVRSAALQRVLTPGAETLNLW
jgi:hypothetical protein